jgi:hypothetical protein
VAPFNGCMDKTTLVASRLPLERYLKQISAGRNQSLTSVFAITYNQQRLVQLGSR